MADSGVRTVDLLIALSLATDLGLGQPSEHMLRAARLGLRIGERLGLDAPDLTTLYDVSILTYVGCPVYGNEAALIFGDDIEFRERAIHVDLAGLPARKFMLGRAGAGASPLHRVRQAATLMATGGRGVAEQMANHCSAAGLLAQRLGLDPDVQAGLEQSYARWDGKGVPAGLERDRVSLAARISHVAEACEVFQRTASVDDAVEMTRSRRGTHFDPEIVAVVERDPASLFAGIDDDTVDALLDAAPVDRPPLTDEELDDALAAIGDFCDLRCPYFANHAAGAASLVASAAEYMGIPAAEATLVALIHDVGRFGVPATVWDKAGPLNERDLERMRLHVYFVERIFHRPEPLRRIGLLAATHHERMDGSGYHRGVGGTMLSAPARLLAAADAYHAMTQPRPHRPAMSDADAAQRHLRADATAGRLDPVAVDAVRAAAGHAPSRSRAGGPAGLTARESEVLGLLAIGLPNKGIARRLGISPKTVDTHIEHIYTKLGVSNRGGAALHAMHHGLVASVDHE